MQQLGSTEIVPIGLGDDQNKYGYFAELDKWVENLLPILRQFAEPVDILSGTSSSTSGSVECEDHYDVKYDTLSGSIQSRKESKQPEFLDEDIERHMSFFLKPDLFKHHLYQRICDSGTFLPIIGAVKSNTRMTKADWTQDVRDVRILLTSTPSSIHSTGTAISDMSNTASPAIYDDKVVRSAISAPATVFTKNLSTSGSCHVAGDVAVIYPMNDPSLVTRMMSLLNKEGNQHYNLDTTIDIKCLSGFIERKSRIHDLKCCTLRRLFSSYLDISGRPQRGFFEMLALYAKSDDEREKLLEISSAEGTDLYYDYCIKEKRNYVEVLEDFKTARPSLSKLLEILPIVQPRHYSIANSGLIEHDEIHLCVAVASTKTPYGRERTGLCSGYLSSLVPGDQILLWVRSGSLVPQNIPSSYTGASSSITAVSAKVIDENATKSNRTALTNAVMDKSAIQSTITDCSKIIDKIAIPKMILIGPGTGVAPMRALIQERRLYHRETICMQSDNNSTLNTNSVSDASSSIDTLLFFGCRNRCNDFLYGDEWIATATLQNNSAINCDLSVIPDPDLFQRQSDSVIVAFSRDQKEKVYVTNKIKEHGQLVWRMLSEVQVYIKINRLVIRYLNTNHGNTNFFF